MAPTDRAKIHRHTDVQVDANAAPCFPLSIGHERLEKVQIKSVISQKIYF